MSTLIEKSLHALAGVVPRRVHDRLAAKRQHLPSCSASPAAAPLACPVPVPKPAAVPAALSLSTLQTLHRQIFGSVAARPHDTDAEQLATITKDFFQNHLRVPGLDYKELIEAEVYRMPQTGKAKFVQLSRQEAINKLFKIRK